MSLLSPKEIAEQLSVSTETVLHWIHTGQLEATDCSRNQGGKPRWRITHETLETFLLQRSPETKSSPPRRKREYRKSVIEFYEL